MNKIASEILHIAMLLLGMEIVGKSGMQQKRKDKDTSADTGGTSKVRHDPHIKPPRNDVRKPFSTKNKKTENRDKDIDNDPDMKG